MKTTCSIIALLFTLSLAPVFGGETNSASINIDQKLRDIDLKLMLEQYEKIQREIMALRFEEALGDAEDRTEEQKKEAARRNKLHEILVNELHQLTIRSRDLAAKSAKEGK